MVWVLGEIIEKIVLKMRIVGKIVRMMILRGVGRKGGFCGGVVWDFVVGLLGVLIMFLGGFVFVLWCVVGIGS